LIISVIFTSCENGDWSFDDFDYSAVYFAYQTPVRTITLGTDYLNDNSLNNQRKFQIMATVGGLREVKRDIEVSFVVDNSLCDGLKNVTAMPADYYSLSDNSKIIIKKGSKMIGGVVVTLTDKFFADTRALKKYAKGKVILPEEQEEYYVIPLRITHVENADSVLSGKVADLVDNPNRVNPADWEVKPKDYILCAVKFMNPYDVWYLRRGTDIITENGVTRTVRRERENPLPGVEEEHYSTPERDQVIKLNSISYTGLEFSATNHKTSDNKDLGMTFKLDFDTITQKCTFADGAWKNTNLYAGTPVWNWNDFRLVNEFEQIYDEVRGLKFRVFDIAVSGNGEYVKDGEKKSWGNKDRDALYLNYQVQYSYQYPIGSATKTVKYETADTLVFRDRGVKLETFTPKF